MLWLLLASRPGDRYLLRDPVVPAGDTAASDGLDGSDGSDGDDG